jgi:sugar lactone lactonase YvrE
MARLVPVVALCFAVSAALAQNIPKNLVHKAKEQTIQAAGQMAREAVGQRTPSGPEQAVRTPVSTASNNSPAFIPGGSPVSDTAEKFLELTTPYATGARAITQKDIARGFIGYDGNQEDFRWNVTNPYLPGDRNFLSMIYGAACAKDGTLFVTANGVVSASETGQPPRANRDWYADNGTGVWRVAPDGRVTAFSVSGYGNKSKTAVCNVNAAEAAFHSPTLWGGAAVSANGDVYVSLSEYHMILRLRSDGHVEHVAGGGQNACVYDQWKDKKEFGHRDGPGRQALFNSPGGLAFDREGNLLLADQKYCALRRIDPSGNVTTVFKGSTTRRGTCMLIPDDEEKPEKWIKVEHIAIDPQGRPVVGGSWVIPSVNIFSNIHRLNPDGRVEQLLSATKGYANSGKLGVETLSGMTYLPDGTLLFADAQNNLLRTLNGTRLSDWLGVQGDKGDKDINGPAAQAMLRRPGRLCLSGDGTLFVSPYNPRSSPVRKIDPKTRAVSTWLY